MAVDTVFKPLGPTVLIVASAVQVTPAASGQMSYRVRNLTAVGTGQYFTWGPTSSVSSTSPSAGTPAANTIGMVGGGVETFDIPPGMFFIASSVTGFEFTPGIGTTSS